LRISLMARLSSSWRNRRDEVVEGFGVAIEVDEDEAGEADVLDFAQGDVAVAELAATEFLPFEDEFVAPAGVPAPAVNGQMIFPPAKCPHLGDRAGRVGQALW